MDKGEKGFVEKRKEPRYACDLDAIIRKGRKKYFGRITNISQGGLEIRVDQEIEIDEFIVEFKVDRNILTLSCQMVSLIKEDIQSVLHAKFIMIPTETRHYFEDFLTYSELTLKKI